MPEADSYCVLTDDVDCFCAASHDERAWRLAAVPASGSARLEIVGNAGPVRSAQDQSPRCLSLLPLNGDVDSVASTGIETPRRELTVGYDSQPSRTPRTGRPTVRPAVA